MAEGISGRRATGVSLVLQTRQQSTSIDSESTETGYQERLPEVTVMIQRETRACMARVLRTPLYKAAYWAVQKSSPAVAWLADRGAALIKDRLSSRHVVTSVYVVYNDKVLLIHHRGLNRWLAPGGHMSFGETPDECAAREVREETGLVIQITDGETGQRCYREAGVTILHRPLAVQLEEIAEKHEHIDLVYAAVASSENVVPANREITEFRWFSGPELAAAELDENVKIFASRALMLGRLHQESAGDAVYD